MRVEKPSYLVKRRSAAEARLARLRDGISLIPVVRQLPELCIYVTGSYGRLEGSDYSDLDVFFVSPGSSSDNLVPRTKKTLLDADLIRLIEELDFPPFSNDAQYLQVHYLDDMKRELGSPSDDYRNYFTARMLLLLESRPLAGEAVYEQMLEEVISTYYRDYHDHETDFRPVFLVNDIVRFWKTLCLNYEHKRNRPAKDRGERSKAHLRNFKLKFSRMATCLSSIIVLSRNRGVIAPEEVLSLVREPPLDRIALALGGSSNAADLYNQVLKEYAWFLEATDGPIEKNLTWISERGTREEAFSRARKFGTLMYKLLLEVTRDSQILRYVVI
jgi:predicted nucleotidyltransferase